MTRKGQVTLPKEVREQLGLEPFDKIEVWVENGEARLRKVPRSLKDLLGVFRAPEMPLEEAIARAKAVQAEKRARRTRDEDSEQQ